MNISIPICQSAESVACLQESVSYIAENGIHGAFVECGVYAGASECLMIRTLQHLKAEPRDLWLYDTFEGMPRPGDGERFRDEPEGETMARWERQKNAEGTGSSWVCCSLETVRDNLHATGYPRDRLHFVKGMVENTIPGQMPETIAILRLDTDFYSSTKHEFEHLYPRLVRGGVVIVDDYGAFLGSRTATDEYRAAMNITTPMVVVDEHVRMWTKQ